MSEKLQVTAEQHLALKDFFSFFKESPLKTFTAHGKLFNAEYKSLINLTIDQMATAQFVGYEIEPKFKLDDLVVTVYENQRNVTGRVTKIIGDDCVRIRYSDNGEIRNRGHYPEYLRHATKEEIIFAELGREVGEFVEGDTYQYKNGHAFTIPSHKSNRMEYAEKAFKNGQLKGFYPANSFIKLP